MNSLKLEELLRFDFGNMEGRDSKSDSASAYYAQGLGGIIASGMWADRQLQSNTISRAFAPVGQDTPRLSPSSSGEFTSSFTNPFLESKAHVPIVAQSPLSIVTKEEESHSQQLQPQQQQQQQQQKQKQQHQQQQQQQQPSRASSSRESAPEAAVETKKSSSSKADWICVVCGNKNYSWRHVCNMRKCRAPKPGHLTSQPLPPGSWACLNCGNLNYAERTVCNMRKCRSPRPSNQTKFKDFGVERTGGGDAKSKQGEQARSSGESVKIAEPEENHAAEYALWGADVGTGIKKADPQRVDSTPALG